MRSAWHLRLVSDADKLALHLPLLLNLTAETLSSSPSFSICLPSDIIAGVIRCQRRELHACQTLSIVRASLYSVHVTNYMHSQLTDSNTTCNPSGSLALQTAVRSLLSHQQPKLWENVKTDSQSTTQLNAERAGIFENGALLSNNLLHQVFRACPGSHTGPKQVPVQVQNKWSKIVCKSFKSVGWPRFSLSIYKSK